ncbi:MAG: dihydropteroate synthase [Desulfomonile tiedjei]|uniref:Dihydropteroate synthase n=1 Tax=Desulfomonile tiedjei TaxID=2358 RepID=A0A9D6Z1P8_9BACT|nr:dihydropteroate synthase [Desulfomonile tiedjei]
MLLAADNIHAMNAVVSDALRELDPRPIQELARACESNGAQFIDLNPGYLSKRNEDRMAFLVETVQEVTTARLILDSPNPRVLARGLAVCKETPVLNALSLEPHKLEEILPLAVDCQTQLVLLLMDERSFTPPSTEEKIAIAAELREHALGAGVKGENLIFDPVLPNLSWDDAHFRVSEGLKAVRLLASGAIFQEPASTMVGLSNLRSGQIARYPARFEETCLALFAGAGLKIVLANALRPELRAAFESITQMTVSDVD